MKKKAKGPDERYFAAGLLLIFALLVLYIVAKSVFFAPAPMPTPTPTPTLIPTASATPAASQTPTPISSPTPTPSLAPNFEPAWNMSSLEFSPYLPASSFPDPPPKVERTTASLITIGGKPLVVIFTLTTCPHCTWEKPTFREAMAGFGDSIVVKEVDARTAPFEYQPLFMNYSKRGLVPFILIGGVYSRTGSNEQSGIDDATSRAEEADRLTATTCLLFASGEKPPVCAG